MSTCEGQGIEKVSFVMGLINFGISGFFIPEVDDLKMYTYPDFGLWNPLDFCQFGNVNFFMPVP